MIRLQLSQQPTKSHSLRQVAPASERGLTLPCPADACLDLALALVSPKAGRAKTLHQTIRLNPSLLLWALQQYHLANKEPATNAKKLVRWIEKHGLAFFRTQAFSNDGQSLSNSKKSRRLLRVFLRARSQTKCRLALNRWLKLHSDLSKGERKSMLKSLVAKSFRLDQFRTKKIRRESTLQKAWHSWIATSATERQVPQILDIVSRLSDLDAEFDRCLLSEKLAAMKQLAYGASHEINNPLANVATRAQTLLADETHPERRNKLATIYQQAMRAHEMISDLMLFANPPASTIESVSLRRLLRPFIGRLEQQCSDVETGVQIRILIGPHLERVNLDPTQFLVVLDALIQNSREAIRSNSNFGEIKIHFGLVHGNDDRLPTSIRRGESAEWLRVAIWDDGPTVDKRIRRHMFDPFFSGREAGRGLGFGLSKAWRVAQQHGGELQFDANCKPGTQFVLWLPQNESARNSCGKAEDWIVKMPILPDVKSIAG